MIVTLTAIRRQPKIDPAERLHSIGCIDGKILGFDRAAFVGRHVAALKTSGDLLFQRRVVQQIAGKLFDGELIKRLVTIERANDPVTVRPHFSIVVEVHAVCVCVPSCIQPIPTAMLTPFRRIH